MSDTATKICRKCGVEKEIHFFYSTKRFEDGKMRECAECCKLHTRTWRLANPEKNKEITQRSYRKDIINRRMQMKIQRDSVKHTEKFKRQMRSNELHCTYGITLQDYEMISKSQNHLCAICGIPQSEQRRRMSIDHDHKTGKIRALLCSNCNVGIGNFKESPEILNKAIHYLNEHTTTNIHSS